MGAYEHSTIDHRSLVGITPLYRTYVPVRQRQRLALAIGAHDGGEVALGLPDHVLLGHVQPLAGAVVEFALRPEGVAVVDVEHEALHLLGACNTEIRGRVLDTSRVYVPP